MDLNGLLEEQLPLPDYAANVRLGPGLSITLELSNQLFSVACDEGRLTIGVKCSNFEETAKIDALTRSVLKELHHTPLAAMGVNLAYEVSHLPEAEALFGGADYAKFALNNVQVPLKQNARKLRINEDCTLNLTLTQKTSEHSYVFYNNFHHALQNKAWQDIRINGEPIGFCSYDSYILDLTKKVYGVNLEEEIEE